MALKIGDGEHDGREHCSDQKQGETGYCADNHSCVTTYENIGREDRWIFKFVLYPK